MCAIDQWTILLCNIFKYEWEIAKFRPTFYCTALHVSFRFKTLSARVFLFLFIIKHVCVYWWQNRQVRIFYSNRKIIFIRRTVNIFLLLFLFYRCSTAVLFVFFWCWRVIIPELAVSFNFGKNMVKYSQNSTLSNAQEC